jgi:hypothetical protein
MLRELLANPPLFPAVLTGQCAKSLDSADNPVLPYNGGWTAGNTPAKCIALCREENYEFAGVYHGSCYCGHTAPGSTVSMDECDDPCTGDNSKKCGGWRRMNVYSVTGRNASSWLPLELLKLNI